MKLICVLEGASSLPKVSGRLFVDDDDEDDVKRNIEGKFLKVFVMSPIINNYLTQTRCFKKMLQKALITLTKNLTSGANASLGCQQKALLARALCQQHHF